MSLLLFVAKIYECALMFHWLVHINAVMTWYVVYKGKVPGVYNDWKECRRQVHCFSGNSYKGYTTRTEAESRYTRYLAERGGSVGGTE